MSKVAATCGCFDMFHDGHVSILQACHLIADRVVVFLNSDESINRIKGEHKPVTPLEARYNILTSIKHVDSVIVFHEDTPVESLQKYFDSNPDIGYGNFFWLKPAYDYAISGIPEREAIQSRGGLILYYDSPIIRSSTEIIRRVKEGRNAIEDTSWNKEW